MAIIGRHPDRSFADAKGKDRMPAASSFSHTGPSLTRRSFLQAGAAMGLAGTGLLPAPHAQAAGSRTGAVPFGGAIMSDHFDEPEYREAFLRHCGLIMPMNELKFSQLRPQRDVFNFEPADRLVDWALGHGKLSRGHTHVWWGATPDWVEAVTDPEEAEAILVDHIELVGARYAGRLESWDVVNEVIAHDPADEGPLRDTYWMRTLGPRHIPLAFEAAARADPGARLVLNDYDLEFVGDRYDRRRKIALSLVRQLQDRNIPIHAVGIHGHLYADLRIDVGALAAFGEELRRMGLGLLVTELDIIDWKIRGGPAEQDAAAMRIVGDLLDGVFAAGPPEAVVAWGITDRYSWIPEVMPREDGKPSRPLPLDANYREKPWLDLIHRRLAAA